MLYKIFMRIVQILIKSTACKYWYTWKILKALQYFSCIGRKNNVFLSMFLRDISNFCEFYCVVTEYLWGGMGFRAPDKLRICVFYAMKTSKNACIVIMHTYCCVSKLSKFGAYITIHFCLWEIPCNYFPLYFSKDRAYTSEGYRMLAFLSIDVKRDLIGCLR